MTECSWIIAPFYHPNKDIKNDFFKKYAVNSFANTIHICVISNFPSLDFPIYKLKEREFQKFFLPFFIQFLPIPSWALIYT